MPQPSLDSTQSDTAGSPAAAAAAVTGRSGSTFYWPMLLLPRSKRAAMFAIYAFCRRIDDIADEPGDPAEKRAALDAWRTEIRGLYAGGAPSSSLGAALKGAIERYGLPRGELEALIDGMAMDIPADDGNGSGSSGGMTGPALPTLRLYCRRVAGAVGMLAIRVFDRADASTEAFALALGEALQLTNILRDLTEDAEIGRLYLPRELLDEAGIGSSDPATVLAHPNLPQTCEALAVLAEERFAEARRALAEGQSAGRRGSLWAAVAMMVLYHRLLVRLRARGWRDLDQRVRVGKRECALVAVRCALGYPPAA
ncbi:presqualene diphosphate synthase HpnD [Azospirillum sp. Vi22]|uniref:presqualene diphosphate synthase HpnD n=1 Tax=Azospirillum baldaniorum TaxID=1064539 RepID=UPI00119F52FA|nr:presqualene diphosphate synthase HpnD [Azospirillum baldaniorum]NUB05382.1 presqualene diphosphate synthase HpnD [Azospirillum baldaniorum]TWA70765.1 farnesyl-diphosphate farnesyltransferase [Azospirillum baldaniorum]